MTVEVPSPVKPPFRFCYEHYGTKFPEVVVTMASGRDLQARLEQRQQMPHLAGEFVLDKPLEEMGFRLVGTAIIRTLEAHAAELGFQPVFGGYRALNLYKLGVLFGKYSDERAIEVIAKSRKFNAVTVPEWLEVVGFAKNNPFDHMCRGDGVGVRAPALVAFDVAMLEQVGDGQLYIPKNGASIEETVRAVYYPLGVKLGDTDEGEIS